MKNNPPMLVIGNPPKKRGGLVHFAKGSPEAREHMARLRAMRGKKNPLTESESIKIENRAKGNLAISKKYSDARLPLHAIHHAGLAQGRASVVEDFSADGYNTFDATSLSDEAYDRSGMLMQREHKWGRKGNPRRPHPTGDDLVCSYCGSTDFTYMGQLGPNQAYRCRRCGMDKMVRGRNPMPPSQDPYARMWAVNVKVPKGALFGGRTSDRHFVMARSKQEAAAIVMQTLMHDYGAGKVTSVAPAGGGRPRNPRHRMLPVGLLAGPRRMRRGRNPAVGIPPHIANDPQFRAELAAYRKRHGNGPVRITQIKTPAGFPKFVSAYGKAPEIKYDAPAHSNKGKRIHKFGEGGGSQPWLVTSAARGPRFLAFVGGTFRASNWLYR